MKAGLAIAALVLTVALIAGLYAAGPKTKATNAPCVVSSSRSGGGSRRSCSYKRTNAFERIKGAVIDLHETRHQRR
jgi:hypothetical protein